jgi:NAD(P)-dependent dehydrogenase (short-subunit alcohol dehydrogenase family)
MDEGILKSLFGLDGKVAIVTGGGRGLGRSMALALALAHAGADLALVSRTEAELKKVRDEIKAFNQEREVFLIVADLTDFAEIPRVVEKVVAHYGRVDILINNAGRNIRDPAEDFSIQNWDAVMDINLKGAFIMAQTVGRVMIRQGRGKIINTLSLTSFIGLPNMVAYCASRGGVHQMTKALAVEWAKYGIHVNAIAPGYFLTKQTAPLFEDPNKKEWMLSKIPIDASVI